MPPTGTPTSITVGSGTDKTGVDALLDYGAAISGKVTHPGGQPYPDAAVDVCVGNLCVENLAGADGTYRIDGLAAGDAQVCFYSPDASHSMCLPNPVHLTAGAVTPNVNGGPGD